MASAESIRSGSQDDQRVPLLESQQGIEGENIGKITNNDASGFIQNEQSTSPQSQPQQHVRQEESTLSQGWKVWKQKHGSAHNGDRKVSSIDPLVHIDSQAESNPDEILLHTQNGDYIRNDTNSITKEANYGTNSLLSYLNPWSYFPSEVYNFQVPSSPQSSQPFQQSDSRSIYSSSVTSTISHLPPPANQGWFGWIWNQKNMTDDELVHDVINSTDQKQNIKESKKAIQNHDSVWAWYQNRYNDNQRGQISVLGAKSEMNPVELLRYPRHHGNSQQAPPPSSSSQKTNIAQDQTQTQDEQQAQQLQDASVESQNGINRADTIIPSLLENYRDITTRTKIRIASGLYYNFPTELHIYRKRSLQRPIIQHVLVISLHGNSKSKSGINSQFLNDRSIDSIKEWYGNLEINYEYQVETISLEVGKISNDSLDDIFKLLINWRETFKKVQFLFIIGYQDTVPLATSLLDILLSRNLFDSIKKTGLLSIEGTLLGPYSDSPETSINYSKDFNKTLERLLNLRNTKITFVGTVKNIPSTLALHLKHPNIFRSLLLPKTSYNNDFELQLFKILLTSKNLGHSSSRLLLQISKYFNTNISSVTVDGLKFSKLVHNAVENSLSTTSLLKRKPLTQEVINDPILANDFNLLWTLHAFIDEYKKIKHVNSIENIQLLLDSYKKWDPLSKNLKDLKYMLEVLNIDDYSGTIFRS